MSNQDERIAVINGLRGLAILGVIYHHLFWEITFPGSSLYEISGYQIPTTFFLSNGWMAVNVFFILSGFVLYYPYATQRRNLENIADITYFYQRRALRLYPLFILNVLVCILFLKQLPADEAFIKFLEMASGIFHFTAWLPSINWVLWSLGIEIWFSVLFPLVVILLRRFGWLSIILMVGWLALMIRYYGSTLGYQSPYINPVKDNIFGRLDDFLVGMFICHLFVSGSIKRPVTLFILGIVTLLISCIVWDLIAMNRVGPWIEALAHNGIQLATAGIMLGLLGSKNLWLTWLFELRAIQVLGMMTYSLYVWHGVSLFILKDQRSPVMLGAYFFLLLALSTLTYRYVEFRSVKDWRKLFLIKSKS